MSWYGPTLDDDQREVLAMLNDLGSSQTGTPDEVRAAVIESGIWALGAPEEFGGAGADMATTLLVLERLGRHWPALAWASAQAQAALSVLSDGSHGELIAGIAEGTAAVSVVEAESVHVDLRESAGTWTGQIDRIDMAAARGTVIVLDGPSTALVFAEESLSFEPVRVTGLAGAQTHLVTLDSAPAVTMEGDLIRARALLRLGAGAIAAGIAGAASDAARDYATGRTQFGGPLTEIPVVRQSLADQAFAASQAITTVMSSDTSSLMHITAAMAGAVAAAVDATGKALQSHGGYGYLDDYPTGRFVRDAVSIRAAVDSFTAAQQAAREHAALPWATLKEGQHDPVNR